MESGFISLWFVLMSTMFILLFVFIASVASQTNSTPALRGPSAISANTTTSPCAVNIYNWCSFSVGEKVGICFGFAALIICTMCMACQGAKEDWGDWDGAKRREQLKSRGLI